MREVAFAASCSSSRILPYKGANPYRLVEHTQSTLASQKAQKARACVESPSLLISNSWQMSSVWLSPPPASPPSRKESRKEHTPPSIDRNRFDIELLLLLLLLLLQISLSQSFPFLRLPVLPWRRW